MPKRENPFVSVKATHPLGFVSMVHTCLFSWQASNLIIKGRRLWDPLRAGLAEPGAGGGGLVPAVGDSGPCTSSCEKGGGLLIIPLLKMAKLICFWPFFYHARDQTWDLNSVSLQCDLQVCTFTEKCRPVVSQATVFSLLRHKYFSRALKMWRVVVF